MTDKDQKGDGGSTADLHLLLSEKYMAYKDLAERCVIDIRGADKESKGDNRCFYMQPKSPFLDEPRVQNQYRNKFVSAVGQPPCAEPLTLLADDLHKAYIDQTTDKSNPDSVKQELCNFFKRRQYQLQHKRYKLQLRWAHYALTSDAADKISIKLNPYYSKVQFELENAVKRHQRLEGIDHFLTPDRPKQEEGSSYADDGVRPPLSALRADDIDVYLRICTYEEKITKEAHRFLQRAKWVPFSHRWEVYQDSIHYFQSVRKRSIQEQMKHIEMVEEKGQALIDLKKLGNVARKELDQIKSSKHVLKQEDKIKGPKAQYMATAKYNYELPPLVYWNEIDLKIQLQKLADQFMPSSGSREADMESDNGHTFSYSVMVTFPTQFQNQAIMNQFAPYDAIPSMIDPANLAKKNIKKVLRRNQKKYGRTQGANTLLEKIEIEKHEKEMGVEFLNSVEKSLFGEFNGGRAQLPEFPSVRVKKSDWIELVCFKPKLGNDQLYQAAILASEKNWIDECLANMLETLNVQDVQNVNLIMESLSQLHYDKVKHGAVKTDFLNFDANDVDTFFTEDQKQFISLFRGCFKAKGDFDANRPSSPIETESLHEIPQHLLFANYLLQCLNAREQKTRLLYTLNSFRAIQRRLTLELREMGTRDRVLGDAQLVMPMEHRSENNVQSTDDDDSSETATTPVDQVGVNSQTDDGEKIDLMNDPLVDINKYRFNRRFQNYLHTTCPIVPKFHSTYGQPIERQEISQEVDNGRNTDSHKQENKKLVGRVDQIYKHPKTGYNLVKDDFGVHVLYDATFADMRGMEVELLKICSYYINKAEPLLDNDLRNMYPVVDRLKILDEVLGYENQYQEAKLHLAMAYLECYEHSSDILEQQRIIQAIVDEMAKRPRLNLSGSHFKDSYLAEVECLNLKTKLVREVIQTLMSAEKKENNHVREYIEKAYRLLYEHIKKEWQYLAPEEKEDELNQRQLINTKEAGTRNSKNDMLQSTSDKRRPVDETELQIRRQEVIQQVAVKESYTFTSLADFAQKLDIPLKTLEMMMKDHHERDHLVRQSVHEHSAFIKVCEGYPQFISHNSVIHNKFKFTDRSEAIGILDFYESLQLMPKVIATIERAVSDLEEVHKPDNGLLTTALEMSTIKFLVAELKLVKDGDNGAFQKPQGMHYLEDNHVVGNPDKMLFFTKELAAGSQDPRAAQNPFVIGKLAVSEVSRVDFAPYMGYIDPGAQLQPEKEAEQSPRIESQQIQHKNFGKFYSKLQARTGCLAIPSMLFLCCNSVEVLRLRNTMLAAIEQAQILEDVYQRQATALGRECKVNFKEQMNIASFFNGGEHFVNFIEEGPGSDLEIKLAINEFDQQLRSAINFSDPESFKALILPLGLEELRAVTAYELMNLQALIVAVRTNQVQMDNTERKLCEIDFFLKGFTVANPVFDLAGKLEGTNLLESRLAKLPAAERTAAKGYLSASVGKGYYNIIERKGKMKEIVEKTFKQVKNALAAVKDQKVEVMAKKLRALKLVMCHDYCQDVLARVYNDSIKLQILYETDTLRKRSYLLPRECGFLELDVPRQGEHQFAAYNADNTDAYPKQQDAGPAIGKPSSLFYSQEDNRIQSFWRLPTNSEVLNLDANVDKFKEINMVGNLNYDLGSQAEGSQPEFAGEQLLEMIQARVPKLTLTDSLDVDLVVKERHRLVEFEQAFDYNEPSKLVRFLRYWKQVSNIYDLEFFINKLASSAFAIANVEKMVLSGVPFYEEGDDALLADMDGEGSEEEDEEVNAKQEAKQRADTKKGRQAESSKFAEDGHKPLKNVLAGKVAEKIAQDKREKMQLIQDLESIKDKFTDYAAIMKKQEMASNLVRAETFLSELHQIVFNGILFTLYQLQDNYFKEKKGQKEIQTINEVIQNLSHQSDLKVTYLNGFHVNYAITSLERLNVDCGTYSPDYDSFFKATQPLIDEEALNPPEFNLVQGIYLTNSVNLVTFKKDVPYMGNVFLHDYKCLDFALTNLSKEIRKYLMTNLGSIEMTLQSFIQAKMKWDEKEEKEYQSNPSIYAQIMQEKKNYLKMQIKARQLRRIFMMISHKRTIPLDIEEYNEMYQQYQDDMQWKLVHHMDGIANSRKAVQQREEANQKRKNPAGQIQQSMKQAKEPPALKSVLAAYDQATSEIQVVQAELQRYMIQISFEMFQNETDALAKTFEMQNLRGAAFIHPAQQFASTFHSNIDKRNHLDIINKVGPIQKMLTQIKNRCLEIETLTSGTGIVISSKDLNECLEECCRSLIKYGEIEMRTRCEYLATNLIQYENLLYIKDRQLLNLENKLRTAKVELNKIVNTKVFSRGNNLIYELDMTNRQLRLMKDNVFLMEKDLTEEIKLCYDRELAQTKMQLADKELQFKEYQDSVSAKIKARVREEHNTIDGVMKETADRYKDLDRQTQRQQAFAAARAGQVNNTTVNIDQLIISKDGTVTQPGGTDPKLLEELEALKASEKEARDEGLRLMDIIRRNRLMHKFKEVLRAERHEFQLDNLKQQLTSNTTLWEQLAESEKREKILKQEIERAQQEIATQEKIIERLKDDIKKEGREKQKLLQFQSTKSRRLDALETKAREFEVLSSVNLDKILGLLENKEHKIAALSKAEENMGDVMTAMKRVNDKDMQQVRKQAQEETRYKVEAMTKLEGLRQELQTIQGNEAPSQSVSFWKEQCQNLFDICRNLKEDNEKLVTHVGYGDQRAGLQIMPQQNSESSAHPFDQFQNNQDLLNFLNQQQAMQGQRGGPSHRRNNSQQANTLPRNTYDLAYGMSQNLQDHMMGISKGTHRNSRGGNSSINSFTSEQKDFISQNLGGDAAARFALPKIQIGKNMGIGTQPYLNESLVIGGSVAHAKYNPTQNGPFMGKMGAEQQDNINSLGQGKMTPMYEKQQNLLNQKRGIFGPGGVNNVFSSLNDGNSIHSSAGKNQIGISLPGGSGGQYESTHLQSTSIDRTTNITGNMSAQRGSAGQPQYSQAIPHDPNVSTDLAGNIFNFAPQTQRTPINLDGREMDDQHQDSLNQPMQSTRVPLQQNEINEFGEIGSSIKGSADGGQQDQPGQMSQKKGGEAKLLTQLQPKLISPPSKLVKTLDPKGAKASYIKRKPNAPVSKELNQF